MCYYGCIQWLCVRFHKDHNPPALQVTYKRYRAALQQLVRTPDHPLVHILHGTTQPRCTTTPTTWTPMHPTLDPSQITAITHALASVDLALIHGPPGTGKTTAVVEYIAQEVGRGNRVLVCAASNIAVDNVVERLAYVLPKVPMVRVGHPARLLPSVLGKCLEAAVAGTDSKGLAKDVMRDMQRINARLLKLGRKVPLWVCVCYVPLHGTVQQPTLTCPHRIIQSVVHCAPNYVNSHQNSVPVNLQQYKKQSPMHV